MTTSFEAFPKIGRLNRDVIVTEKLDGTNGHLFIIPYAEREIYPSLHDYFISGNHEDQDYLIAVGSRNRWIRPGDDNYGFAAWVQKNSHALAGLGLGRHYGEWWGNGIQRGYGLKEKRFSLFNVTRWGDSRPACCHVVPTLFSGSFSTATINDCVKDLKDKGSLAAPGFMKPEGVIVFHTANSTMFKVTCEKDEVPKSMAKEAA